MQPLHKQAMGCSASMLTWGGDNLCSLKVVDLQIMAATYPGHKQFVGCSARTVVWRGRCPSQQPASGCVQQPDPGWAGQQEPASLRWPRVPGLQGIPSSPSGITLLPLCWSSSSIEADWPLGWAGTCNCRALLCLRAADCTGLLDCIA